MNKIIYVYFRGVVFNLPVAKHVDAKSSWNSSLDPILGERGVVYMKEYSGRTCKMTWLHSAADVLYSTSTQMQWQPLKPLISSSSQESKRVQDSRSIKNHSRAFHFEVFSMKKTREDSGSGKMWQVHVSASYLSTQNQREMMIYKHVKGRSPAHQLIAKPSLNTDMGCSSLTLYLSGQSFPLAKCWRRDGFGMGINDVFVVLALGNSWNFN